ncbi:hypothetical protein TB1_038406 [Malus domestica]
MPMLRDEVAKRSNCNPNSINLICAGRVLKDGGGDEKLAQVGIKNNAKILANRVCTEEGKSLKEELMAEGERSRRGGLLGGNSERCGVEEWRVKW